MKRTNGLFLGSLVLFILLNSCQKENNSVNYSVIDSEKANIQSALALTQAFNDTLIMVYDTAKTHTNNHFCLKYDSLYHHNDSLFMNHYSMFGNEMYKNGMMMNNYTPGNGMMQGGMMNSDSNDLSRMRNDTSIVGTCYRTMQQLHIQHQPYHKGIFN